MIRADVLERGNGHATSPVTAKDPAAQVATPPVSVTPVQEIGGGGIGTGKGNALPPEAPRTGQGSKLPEPLTRLFKRGCVPHCRD